MGQALANIQKNRLFRDSHKTFEQYCRERWEFTATHARRLIRSAEVVDRIEPTGSIVPARESQLRPLTTIDLEQVDDVWQQVVESADRLLFQAGEADEIDQACRSSQIGKLLPNALYVHRAALDSLEPLLRIAVVLVVILRVFQVPKDQFGDCQFKTSFSTSSNGGCLSGRPCGPLISSAADFGAISNLR